MLGVDADVVDQNDPPLVPGGDVPRIEGADVRALDPGDRFEILTFSDDSEAVFGGLVPAQAPAKGRALERVAALEDASRGATGAISRG